jgi:hypothetical protein
LAPHLHFVRVGDGVGGQRRLMSARGALGCRECCGSEPVARRLTAVTMLRHGAQRGGEPARLRIYATEPSVLGAQSVELTLQDDDAVTERGETSVHVELPGLKDWRLRVEVCALLCVFG